MERWKTVFSPRSQYPLLVVVLIVAVSLWSYKVSVRRSETAVCEHSLRVLDLAEAFSSRIATFEHILYRRWKANELRSHVPELESEKRSDLDRNIARNLTISDYMLRIVAESNSETPQQKKALSCWPVSLSSLEHTLPTGSFEDLLLAGANGQLLHLTRRSGMAINHVLAFLDLYALEE